MGVLIMNLVGIFLQIGLVYIICNNFLNNVMKQVDFVEAAQILVSIYLFKRLSEILDAIFW